MEKMITEMVTEEMTDEMVDEAMNVTVDATDIKTKPSVTDIVVKVLLFGALGAAAIAYKNRDEIKTKRDARQIKRLEKRGYVVTKAEPEAVVFENTSDVDETSDDEVETE